MSAAPLCPGCFGGPWAACCPLCGFVAGQIEHPLALLPGTQVDRYVLGRVLGKPGGFGVTYHGWDCEQRRRVAIKEFLPRDLAGRGRDGITVLAHTGDDRQAFAASLAQFENEAHILERLNHPNIVRVQAYVQAHGTGYLVMDYYPGVTLAAHLRNSKGRLSEREAIGLTLPILNGLQHVHGQGFLHRDIKPANIYLAQASVCTPVLLDFGSARQFAGQQTRSLSTIVSEGYAPPEQYHRKGQQGPWTDVYGVAATLYRMLTGQPPPPAHERLVSDDLLDPASLGVSAGVSEALRWGLLLDHRQRPASASDYMNRLYQAWQPEDRPAVVPDPDPPSVPVAPLPPAPQPALVPDVPADDPLQPAMQRIEAGSFIMGSPSRERERYADERQHRVSLATAFAIGRCPVTNAQYRRFRPQHNSGNGFNADDQPAVMLTWHDALAYTEWLSRHSGRRFRLPTEAEWEYAARAGSTTAWPWGDDFSPERAHCRGCGSPWKGSAPVGRFPANAWGLHDTAGNVWEWTASAYDRDYAGGELLAARRQDGDRRVLRGGSWNNLPSLTRSAFRSSNIPGFRSSDTGFRLAETL